MAIRPRLLTLLKCAIAAVVIVFVAQSFLSAREAFRAQANFDWRALQWRWLAVASACYVGGMMPMGCYWHYLLRALGESPGGGRTLVAYFAGHLGKYVPGKAMVVVIRTALLRGTATSATVVAVSVFIETFTMMSVGAALSTALIAWQFSQQQYLLALSVCLMGIASIPTWPPLLRLVLRRLRPASWNAEIEVALAGYTWRVMAVGWCSELAGWALIGCSLWAVLRAMPLDTPLESLALLWPRLTASTSLSMVAGFLSLLPGGLGVRELVLDQLLKQRFGPVISPLSAVTLRLVWLVTELAISGILYMGWRSRRSRASAPSRASRS
jgi:uncharacterized membrane protein YbhN (UPF0104 family)